MVDLLDFDFIISLIWSKFKKVFSCPYKGMPVISVNSIAVIDHHVIQNEILKCVIYSQTQIFHISKGAHLKVGVSRLITLLMFLWWCELCYVLGIICKQEDRDCLYSYLRYFYYSDGMKVGRMGVSMRVGKASYFRTFKT